MAVVDEKPYYPNLIVDPNDEETVKLAASLIVANLEVRDGLSTTIVKGGITNSLFRVAGLPKLDVVLVRVFGGEGLIDRDVENPT